MTGSALQIPTGKNGYSKHVKGATGFPNGGNKIKLERNCIISMKNNFRQIKNVNVKGRNFKHLEEK